MAFIVQVKPFRFAIIEPLQGETGDIVHCEEDDGNGLLRKIVSEDDHDALTNSHAPLSDLFAYEKRLMLSLVVK
jgi:hypothetical protein